MPYWSSDFKRGSLEIKEVFYSNKRKQTKEEKLLAKELGLKSIHGNCKVTLFYKGKEVARMWPVTWKYIYDHAIK
jgi:hypothetical protein